MKHLVVVLASELFVGDALRDDAVHDICATTSFANVFEFVAEFVGARSKFFQRHTNRKPLWVLEFFSCFHESDGLPSFNDTAV